MTENMKNLEKNTSIKTNIDDDKNMDKKARDKSRKDEIEKAIKIWISEIQKKHDDPNDPFTLPDGKRAADYAMRIDGYHANFITADNTTFGYSSKINEEGERESSISYDKEANNGREIGFKDAKMMAIMAYAMGWEGVIINAPNKEAHKIAYLAIIQLNTKVDNPLMICNPTKDLPLEDPIVAGFAERIKAGEDIDPAEIDKAIYGDKYKEPEVATEQEVETTTEEDNSPETEPETPATESEETTSEEIPTEEDSNDKVEETEPTIEAETSEEDVDFKEDYRCKHALTEEELSALLADEEPTFSTEEKTKPLDAEVKETFNEAQSKKTVTAEVTKNFQGQKKEPVITEITKQFQ